MGRVFFTKSAEFLADNLSSPLPMRRIGVVIRASLSNAVDITKRLDDLMQNAWDQLDEAMERKLADYSDINQRNALALRYAGALRMPVEEQLRVLEAGRHAVSVTAAAAEQRDCPEEVQSFLMRHCFDQGETMTAFARNPATNLNYLQQLANHPNQRVRLALATNLTVRMIISERSLTESKDAVYNALQQRYTSDFAPYLVPVCRDEDQLAQMYAQTTKTPFNGRLFVENPFTPTQVLMDIAVSTPMRLLLGGSRVARDAKFQLEKRQLVLANEAAPELC